MSQTLLPAEEKKLVRPHPLTALVRGWGVFVALGYAMLRDENFRKTVLDPSTWHLIPLRYVVLIIAGLFLFFGLFGLAAWWFTKYVVDDEEVRVETGFITRRTKQISMSRVQSVDVIQSLFPRLLGLAEVKIDVGASSATRVRYLSRKQAYAMRDYLLARVHGTAAVEAAGPSTILNGIRDINDDEKVLVRVPAARIVATALLNPMLVSITAFSAMPLLIIAIFNIKAFLTALIPVAVGAASTVFTHVSHQWNYRLLQGPNGVKISRGLLDLTSQSVPLHRIQGVRVSQPLTWKLFGWYRIDVDVLGYGNVGAESEGTSNVLLPCGTIDDVAVALATCFPGLRLTQIPMHPVSPKHRWFHPIAWRGTRWGLDERFLVVERGVWRTRMSLVPHQRIQSVQVRSGPIDRLLGLASTSAYTADGPVNAEIPHLEQNQAITLAIAELDRATTMRRAELGAVPRS